jgi:hypothetical protein
MKKIMDFLNRYGVVVIVLLLLVIGMKECSTAKKVKKMDKHNTEKIETLSVKIDTLSKTCVTVTDLKIEGLKSEKRMIQSCDRKRFDLDRENQIEREIKELEKNK